MGINYTDREKKLKMLKTNKSRKASRKLSKLKKVGKLKKHTADKLSAIKYSKGSDSRKRIYNIEEDYELDRDVHFDEDQEDILPTDMLDADIDWENSAFAKSRRRLLEKRQKKDQEDDDAEFEESRRFKGQLRDNEEEMLPIRLPDGRLLRPVRTKEVKEDENDDEDELEKKGKQEEQEQEDLSGLSAAELLSKRLSMLEEAKQKISSYSLALLADPQENILRLRDLYHLCIGQNVHTLVKETVQKLAVTSVLQVLIDIIPGYAIRLMTEEETKGTKMKKETRKLQNYEESLLRYHLKFLQFLEKNTKRINSSLNVSSPTGKMCMLSVKCLCRLLISAPHFNYSTNIVSSLTKLAMAGHQQTTEEVCTALSRMFKDDLHLKITLFAVKSISTLIKKKVTAVPPELLITLLSIHVNKVQDVDKKSEKDSIMSKKYRLKKERKSKTAKKFDKQLKKLESDLKEVEAAETLSNKLKTATETMKHVFAIYFSILKRMPSLALLEPVLEGLSKFAHLLNIEFFGDIMKSMEELVDQQHLRVLDSLHCIHTVFVMLSGDGHILNVDPYRFYRSIYALMNAIPFEKDPDLRLRETVMLAKCLDMMINNRRKQVPLGRVSSFVYRLLSLAVILDDSSALIIVALVRSFFMFFPKLVSMTESTVDDGEGGSTGGFRVELDDPDCTNALTSEVTQILYKLSKRRHAILGVFVRNIQNGVPSSGAHRLSSQFSSVKPWLLEQDEEPTRTGGCMSELQQFAKKKKTVLSSKNVQTMLSLWIDTKE